MNKAPFLIERTYAASPQTVWKAITDKDDMKSWYFDLPVFKAEPGFQFSFDGGNEEKTYTHHCEVKEVIPGRKLSYSWKYKDYPGESLLTFEIFDEGDHTRLRLTHSGLESFPQDNMDFGVASFTAGWTEIIGKNLKAFLES